MTLGGGSQSDLKQRNRLEICRILFRRRISRAELARLLHLTRTAVGSHIDELMAQGLVAETGTEAAGRGRSPILLDIDPNYGCFGGIYINRTSAFVGAVDIKGRPVAREELPTDGLVPSAVLCAAAEKLRQQLTRANIPGEKLLGVGVSLPGPVDHKRGQVLQPPDFAPWHNFQVTKELQTRIETPVLLENNAAAYTLAELYFGNGRSYNNFILLIVDSGIGSGIVTEGHFLRTGGCGPELGHTSILYNGRMCACGNRGCLERYASVPALLRDCFSPDARIHSWKQVVDRAESGDQPCMQAVEQEAAYLSAALVNYINLMEPQAVVLSGDLLERPALITQLVGSRIAAAAMLRDSRHVEVCPSILPSGSEVLAAATTAIQAFFQL